MIEGYYYYIVVVVQCIVVVQWIVVGVVVEFIFVYVDQYWVVVVIFQCGGLDIEEQVVFVVGVFCVVLWCGCVIVQCVGDFVLCCFLVWWLEVMGVGIGVVVYVVEYQYVLFMLVVYVFFVYVDDWQVFVVCIG